METEHRAAPLDATAEQRQVHQEPDREHDQRRDHGDGHRQDATRQQRGG